MADNVTLNSMSGGSVVGADEISGVAYQRVKLIVGADGTNDGDVASGNPLPVSDAGGALTVDGTVTANLSATDNAVLDTIDAVLDTIDADTGGILTAVQLIDNAISGSEMQVDIVASLPAGTNGIGKLTANSGVDIGDVDILTVVPGTGATNLGKAEDAAHSSGDVGVAALAVRQDTPAASSGTDGDYEPLKVSGGGLWVRDLAAGYSIFRSIDLDETEEDVKTSAGTLHGWFMHNAHTATLFVKFYNATAANTTVGTTTPILTVPIPAGSSANVEFSKGITFATALCAAATTAVADNDTGAPAANVLIANIFYK